MMRQSERNTEILKYIWRGSDCAYLSDLRSPVCYWQIKLFLQRCPMDGFSLEEWNYAYNYILNTTEKLEDLGALRMALLSRLS